MVNVFIAGDSTVQTFSKERAPQAGWGQYIGDYFSEEVRFFNRAVAGRSSKTFVQEGRLDAILEEIQEHDYLFVQMGHNDSSKEKFERYTEPNSEFKSYLKLYIDGARSQGASPVLITPVGRLHMKNGIFINDFPEYCHTMKQLAAEEDVPLIDLMSKSLSYYASVGYGEAQSLFMASINGADHTHFTAKGAKRIAALVADGVREWNLSLSKYAALQKE